LIDSKILILVMEYEGHSTGPLASLSINVI
jgi:hypothetical protein